MNRHYITTTDYRWLNGIFGGECIVQGRSCQLGIVDFNFHETITGADGNDVSDPEDAICSIDGFQRKKSLQFICSHSKWNNQVVGRKRIYGRGSL